MDNIVCAAGTHLVHTDANFDEMEVPSWVTIREHLDRDPFFQELAAAWDANGGVFTVATL